MLNNIIHFSLRNRWAVIVASVLLMLVGVHTTTRMEIDVFPDLNAPTVVVMTEAGGMAPEEVERLVTFPLETAVNGATGVRRVRSSSSTGFSVVWVEFDWGTDIYRARQIVSEKLIAVKDLLPTGVGNPTLAPQSSILGEVLFVSLTADSTSLLDLRTLADRTLRPRFLATGGVAQVTVMGGDIKEYQILLRPERMKHHNVSLDEVRRAVDNMNRNTAAGILYEYGNEYIVRALVSTQRVEELKKAVVKTTNGSPVLLSFVAEVKVAGRVPKIGVASTNEKPAVILTIAKQPGVGTLELTEKLDVALAEMSSSLPPDVKLSTDIYRQARFIESSIDNVSRALAEGAFFVTVVLFLFLMNVRTTIISLITIPLALLVAVLALKAMGLTINTMSLGGMCIAIGSLVDDAIVDVENVYKRLRENNRLSRSLRQSIVTVTFEASREVRMPILNSTLIIIVGFVPLFFLSGMEGRMLTPLGIAFIVALMASTLVALTLTPVLCSMLLGKAAAKPKERGVEWREPWLARKLKKAYAALLASAIRRRKSVLAATGVALVAALAVFATLGHGFLPPFNEGSLTINLTTLPGISLEESDRIGRRAEQLLLSIPEIQTVGRKTGRAELDEHSLGVNSSEIEAPLRLDGRSKERVVAEVREKLKTLPGVNIEIGAPITHRIDAMLSGTRAAVAIKLFGYDLNRLHDVAGRIRNAVADVEGVVDLNVEQQVERPQLKIVPKREMLAVRGITLPEFSEAVGVLLAGETVSQVFEENQSFDLVLKVADESRGTADRIRMLMLDAAGGEVPLSEVADVISVAGPNTINRENVARKVVISANVAGRDLLGVVNDIRTRIDEKVKLPEGYHVELGGQFESQQAAAHTLMVASLLALMVIFILLYKQFGSAMQAAVVMLNLPLALIGGVMAIAASGGVVSIPSIIGFISLFGIATRNGMLLMSRYNDLAAKGMTAKECVMRGSTDRLNPILMTALTSALALLPMVIGGDLPGNEIQSPMAKVILGGLFTSTLLNGFVIPLSYLWLHGRRTFSSSSDSLNETQQ